MRKQWEQILQDNEVRQNLSQIRQELKEEGQTDRFLDIIQGSEEKLTELLAAEDAKTRKNAALLMGDLGRQEFLEPVWAAYQKEEQRFIKSFYLKAIGNFDYREQAEAMKAQLELLRNADVTIENEKHNREEIRELSALIVRIEGVQPRSFTGWNESYQIILLTNRNFPQMVKTELQEKSPGAQVKTFGAGLMARVENLKWVREIRTYQELLFVVKGMETCPLKPAQIAERVVKSQLLHFVEKSHDGTAPYYFRVELKSRMEMRQKSTFIKMLSADIEKLSDRRLINTKDNYEFELRLIENKNGDCNILIRLFTLKDKRFAYRTEAMPTSIRPANAALTVALAKEYLKEGAQILDPFCGVGTMLIERKKAVQSDTAYGVDLQNDAIGKARRNTEQAGQIIHYVNRDFFTFQHEYLFDEVITDMPFEIGKVTTEEIAEIYKQFFRTVPRLLKEGAVLVLYVRNADYVRQLTRGSVFKILKEYEISRTEGTYVMILRYA